MPTERRTTASGGNGIRFKNLLRQAEAQLVERGLKQRPIDALLAPAWHLQEDRNFWEFQSDGFACFIAADFFRYFRLPLPLHEFVIVNRRLHLKPLLELLSMDGHFFALALSKGGNRLLYCSRYGSQRLQVTDMPESLEYTLRFDEINKDLTMNEAQAAPVGAGVGARTQVTYHGHGGETDRELKDLARYFHEVDNALKPVLRGEQAPLILACVEYEHGMFRDLSHYPHVAAEYIHGNPELLKDEELRARGWRIAEPVFMRCRQDAIGSLKQALAYKQGSTDIREIVRAAHDGVIDNLFVPVGQAIYGHFDEDSREVEIHAEREPGDDDLLDLAALGVLAAGGVVWAMPDDEMPTPATTAATLRYPVPVG